MHAPFFLHIRAYTTYENTLATNSSLGMFGLHGCIYFHALKIIFFPVKIVTTSMLFFLFIYHFLCQPQTKNGVNSFGGLGATLIDSLDTLYIMGLEEQFRKARE